MILVKTRISISGFTEAEARDGLGDLHQELQQRHWIIRPDAYWDAGRSLVVVTTHYEGTDVDSVCRAASDEVWDCVIACLNFSSEEIQFTVEESSMVQQA